MTESKSHQEVSDRIKPELLPVECTSYKAILPTNTECITFTVYHEMHSSIAPAVEIPLFL